MLPPDTVKNRPQCTASVPSGGERPLSKNPGTPIASFQKRQGAWRAIVRKKGHPSQSKTCSTNARAQKWAGQVEDFITVLSGGEDVLFVLCNTVQHQLASRGRPGKHFKLLNPNPLGTCALVELGHHGLLAASRGIIQLRVNGVVRVHGLGSKYQKTMHFNPQRSCTRASLR